MSILEVPALIADLYKTTRQLEKIFIGRHFTPDGHLVGSIGEVVAAYVYDLSLEEASNAQFDALSQSKQTIQIKLTGTKGSNYRFRWSNRTPPTAPDLFIGLKLTDNGFVEIYNGPFPIDLLLERGDSSNGQLSIPFSKLSLRNPKTLQQVNALAVFNELFIKETAR